MFNDSLLNQIKKIWNSCGFKERQKLYLLVTEQKIAFLLKFLFSAGLLWPQRVFRHHSTTFVPESSVPFNFILLSELLSVTSEVPSFFFIL